jgi:uncharacterized protein YndB with AHSA1/START domain
MMATLKVTASSPPDQPTITMEREFDAPAAAVFAAHADPEAFKRWYGPDGYSITIISMEFRVGGVLRFIMHGPDGTDYPSRIQYREIVPASRLAYLHGYDTDDDPRAFEVEVTFAALGAGRTLLTRRMVFPSIEARNAVVKFGAVELGMQTVEKLAAYLEKSHS